MSRVNLQKSESNRNDESEPINEPGRAEVEPTRVEFQIRTLNENDDFVELTGLLHRAYGELARMGFRYLATHQDVGVTRERCLSGTCFVAENGGKIVGTATFYPKEKTGGAEWYDRPEVASFGQFAVEPNLQRAGIGSKLMDAVESAAIANAAAEIACDTAEGATHLIDLYVRRGYRLVGKVDWSETNYESVILSKNLQEFGVGAS